MSSSSTPFSQNYGNSKKSKHKDERTSIRIHKNTAGPANTVIVSEKNFKERYPTRIRQNEHFLKNNLASNSVADPDESQAAKEDTADWAKTLNIELMPEFNNEVNETEDGLNTCSENPSDSETESRCDDEVVDPSYDPKSHRADTGKDGVDYDSEDHCDDESEIDNENYGDELDFQYHEDKPDSSDLRSEYGSQILQMLPAE